ncbi:MAG TPA: Imm49 family immunity protein [Archangium sp.]|uniref:Imm49 family immunity protein n=1 Tax=Archangium sp. TaxID=1872627 RepID=UPI002E37AAFD|nr:Imm49 family immunity protein [Archangium sp.]HEX5753832.1 Imm49 family immunity protein [Archangium sp.]
MPQMDVIRENALTAVEELEDGLRQPLTSLQREELLTRLSTYRRIAAIGALLAEGDVPAFRHDLRLSATARRELLLCSPEPAAPSRFRCASRVEPLFDALAAGEIGLARDIAQHSPHRWVADEEFEDDFRYADFLREHLLAGAKTPSPGEERALAAFQKCSGDSGSPRLAVCESLSNRDQEAFDAALEDLLVERDAEFRNAGPPLHPQRFHTERHVFIEGLALLRLAEERGLSTQPEYRMMPGLARR